MNNITECHAECVYMRSVLEDGKFELMSAYERGLSNASQFYETFKRVSEKFTEVGLEYGAAKFKELFDIMSASRFEAKWQTETAVSKIAEIWNYIDICTERLNFYEILDEMRSD